MGADRYYGYGNITVTVIVAPLFIASDGVRPVSPGVNPEGHDPLTPAVLHTLLALADGPLHGYAIMRAVEATSGIRMGPGTVYGTLQRLQDGGWVEDVRDQEDTRRRRYAMTRAGREALAREALRVDRLAALLRDRDLAPE